MHAAHIHPSIHQSIHPSIHPFKGLNKFFPATEKPFRGGKSMQTKNWILYGGECTPPTSIHPSIHPRLSINSSRRQKTCRRASASTVMISNLYCDECTPPLTSIHPSKALNKFFPAAENIFRAQEHANQKVKTSMAVSVRLLSHPSIHPRRVLGKLFLGKTNTLQRATRQTGCSC